MRMATAAARIKLATCLGAALAAPAQAHVAELGIVLLLPTDVYIAAGVAAVAATVALLALLPAPVAGALFRPVVRLPMPRLRLAHVTSLGAAVFLAAAVWLGLHGPRDPMANPLPLVVWTLWWTGLVVVQGLVGDVWRWLNPWTGPAALVASLAGRRAPLRWPRRLGRWPGCATFLAFALFLLVDPAPSDPGRLAAVVAAYWAAAGALLLLFGPRALLSAEAVTMLMRAYGRIGVFGRRGRALGAGLWGWRVLGGPAPTTAGAVFLLLLLGTGSFDGLNETFWWFARIGVNPLEYGGRSEVALQNALGLLAANAALVAVFALSVAAGLRLAGAGIGLAAAFRAFAPSILPIALGYHVAHYYTTALVNFQYLLAAATDPLATGADLLGLGTFYVTTGFFNTTASVRAIWLTQAGAVVIGHVLAILMAHATAVRLFGESRRAALSQTPLAAFMVLYTLFGLWLLASPRGG